MSSKVLLFLGLLLAMVFFISSQVVARDLVDVTSTTIDTSTKEAEKTNGAAINDEKPVGIPGYGTPDPGYCYYGCCGVRSYPPGSGCRCCNFAGEKADANPRN